MKTNCLVFAAALLGLAACDRSDRTTPSGATTDNRPAETRTTDNPSPVDRPSDMPGQAAVDEIDRPRADTPTAAPASPPDRAMNTPETANKAADNSGKNARDVKTNAPTPMDQGNSSTDRAITQQIRKAVVGDEALSMNAKNVKIITQDGRVTLRGPVKDEAERRSVESKAKLAPGVKEIDNQLEVQRP